MGLNKKPDGWYFDDMGPFNSVIEATAHLQDNSNVNEKRDKNLKIALDYHNTYSADPKFWDCFIYMCWMRKWEVFCITHHTGKKQNDKLLDSIGKILDKDHIIFTMGEAKMDYIKEHHNIDIDIWIDNNPIHIVQDPTYKP
jgi:hypothetical protein